MSAAIKVARASVVGRAAPGVPQGDPGLFGGLFGAVKGGLRGLISGGPFGVIKGAASGFQAGFGRPQIPTSIQSPTGPVLPPIPAPLSIASLPQLPTTGIGGRGVQVQPTPGIRAAVQRFFPGGATGLQVPVTTNGFQPKGFHLNKSDYFLKDGTFIAKGTQFVKNRRRNPLNPRALRNAIGRIDAGKIWQGKLHEISTAKFSAAGTRKTC